MGKTSIFQEVSQYQSQLQEFLPKPLSYEISKQVDEQFKLEKQFAFEILQATAQNSQIDVNQLIQSTIENDFTEVYDMIKKTCFLPKSQEIQKVVHLMKQFAERRWQPQQLQILSAYCSLISERELQDVEIVETLVRLVQQLGKIENMKHLISIVQQMIKNYESKATQPLKLQQQHTDNIEKQNLKDKLMQKKTISLKDLLQEAQRIHNPLKRKEVQAEVKLEQKDFKKEIQSHFESLVPLCEEQKIKMKLLTKEIKPKSSQIIKLNLLKQQREEKLEILAQSIEELVLKVEQLDFDVAMSFAQTVTDLAENTTRLQHDLKECMMEIEQLQK